VHFSLIIFCDLQTDVVGYVSNIRYVNITAVSESGVLISGREDHMGHQITNITFENVTISIMRQTDYPDVQSNYTVMGRDYRPFIGESDYYDRFAGPVDGIYVENVNGLSLTDVTVQFVGAKQTYWGDCLTQDDATINVSKTNYVCHAPDAEVKATTL
jgi:hypothetical protein